jgi:5-methylcytosine-specific restriction endonuclease McrA
MLKEKILDLKLKGLNQSEIALKLGCAKSTVCWHFNPEKQLKKAQQRKKKIPPHIVKWQRNISRFSTAKTKNKVKREIKELTLSEASANFRGRLKDYAKKHKSDTERTKMVNIKKVEEKYNITEENTKIICRYTGDVLDWKRPGECEIDHTQPRSKGGENTIENLQILSKAANQAKGDMTHDEFIEFIKKCYHHCCVDDNSVE